MYLKLIVEHGITKMLSYVDTVKFMNLQRDLGKNQCDKYNMYNALCF